MVKRIILLLVIPLLLAACTAVNEDEQTAEPATGPMVVVYRAPS